MFPSIGPFPTYTLLIDIGILATLVWLWSQAARHNREPRRWFDAGLVTTIGALIGARFLFVFANWGYFSRHIFESLAIWSGGLAWPGAVLGGLVGLWLYCRRTKEPFTQILHMFGPIVLALGALSWLGCAAAGCAPGLAVEPGDLPIAVDWPDEYGIRGLRWPTQILGMGFCLLALGWLVSLPEDRWSLGVRTAVAIGLLGLINFAMGWIRSDTIVEFNGWRLDVVGSALMVVLSVALVFFLLGSAEPAQPKPNNNAVTPKEDPPAAG